MPPQGTRLTPGQVDTIRQWITEAALRREHWAFRPLVRPDVPVVDGSGPEASGDQAYSAVRLSNGNTLIVNCHAGPDQPQIVEVTPDKRVVWTFKDFTMFGNSRPCRRPAFVIVEAPRRRLGTSPRGGCVWMGGRAVECTGLENRQSRKRLVGSNPTPSAV